MLSDCCHCRHQAQLTCSILMLNEACQSKISRNKLHRKKNSRRCSLERALIVLAQHCASSAWLSVPTTATAHKKELRSLHRYPWLYEVFPDPLPSFSIVPLDYIFLYKCVTSQMGMCLTLVFLIIFLPPLCFCSLLLI